MIIQGAIGQPEPPPLGIKLSPSSATLNVSETQIFTATAIDDKENPITEGGVMITFTSSNTTVGTVSPSSALTGPDGNASVTFTAIKAGDAFVYATNASASENGSAEVTVTTVPAVFDTGPSAKPYPSISGMHHGTITPSKNITVQKLYTYSCAGTGGHTESVRFENESWNITASWEGYQGDWNNITFDEPFTLYAGLTYDYAIRTGSYPQIHHNTTLTVPGGVINCTEFKDANGKGYGDCWIPAIRIEQVLNTITSNYYIMEESGIKKKHESTKGLLNERQQMLLTASMANTVGYDGVTTLSRITGMYYGYIRA